MLINAALTGLKLTEHLPGKKLHKKHSKLYPHYLLDYEEPWAAINQLIVAKINRALNQLASIRASNHLLIQGACYEIILGSAGMATSLHTGKKLVCIFTVLTIR